MTEQDRTADEAYSWASCAIHGAASPRAWGCPECVVELRKERDLYKRALETKDLALVAAAGEREWLIGLIDKFPELDLAWPEDLKALWWKHFEALKAKANEHP